MLIKRGQGAIVTDDRAYVTYGEGNKGWKASYSKHIGGGNNGLRLDWRMQIRDWQHL